MMSIGVTIKNQYRTYPNKISQKKKLELWQTEKFTQISIIAKF